MMCVASIGGDLAPSLEGREKISQTKISEWGFFRKNSLFSRSKFLMTFFSHRPWFSDFFYLFQDSPHLSCNVVYGPFFTRKTLISENDSLMTHFFLCSCFRTHLRNTTSQNIGGDGCMGRSPTSNFLGDRPPVPLGLCPWLLRRCTSISESATVDGTLVFQNLRPSTVL